MKRLTLLALLLGLPAGALLQHLATPTPSWRRWQQRWSELRRSRGLQDRAPGLVSTGASGERCVACHLGALPGYSVSGHPLFAPHPRLGCALGSSQGSCRACHRGDPRRLDVAGAHGQRSPAGDRLLGLGLGGEARRRWLQAACAGCHRGRGPALSYDARMVPEVAAGLALFLAEGCPACHRLPGVARLGEAGPPLAPSAWRRSTDELRQRLRRPQRFAPASPMPPSSLPAEELERLLVFLVAQASPGPDRGEAPQLADHFPADYPPEATPAAGALWARRIGCAGCHRLGEEPSGVPDLRFVAWTARPDELRTMLLDPGRRVPGTLMPPVRMPSPIPESLLAWLQLQRRPLPSEPGQVVREICGRCHGSVADPRRVVLSRRPPLLEGVAAARLPPARFLEAVTRGRAGTAMAPWGRVLARSFLGELQAALQRGGR